MDRPAAGAAAGPAGAEASKLSERRARERRARVRWHCAARPSMSRLDAAGKWRKAVRRCVVRRLARLRRKPRVALRAPANRQVVSGRLRGKGCEAFVAAARGVRRVDFYVNGRRVNRDRRRPFNCRWNTRRVPDGRHKLKAIVVDEAGDHAERAITVTVENDAGIPPSRCENPAPYPAPLHAEAPGPDGDVSRAFVDPSGCKVTLNGFNVIPVWHQPLTEADFENMRARGFNAVRMVLHWRTNEPERGVFQNLERIDAAVEAARRAGIYVVLDVIHIDMWRPAPDWAVGADPVDKVLNDAKPMVQLLARRYRDNPTVAAYDLVNEPPSWDQNRVLRMYSTMISWVREVDPDKIVMTNAGWGNSSMEPHCADPSMLTHRRNVVHTFHDYFAGDGDGDTVFKGYNPWCGNAGHQTWNGESGYPNPADAPDFEAELRVHVNWARRAGVPIWVGEYGINAESANATAWAEAKTALYNRYGLGRAWWFYYCDGQLGIRDRSCNWKSVVDHLQ